MPQFTIIPKTAPIAAIAVDVSDAERVLGIVSGLRCSEADVLRDGQYAFSIRSGGKGMWIVSNRKHDPQA